MPIHRGRAQDVYIHRHGEAGGGRGGGGGGHDSATHETSMVTFATIAAVYYIMGIMSYIYIHVYCIQYCPIMISRATITCSVLQWVHVALQLLP